MSTPGPPILLPHDLQPMTQGARQSIWSFNSPHPFEVVTDPGFLRGHTLVLKVGDQVLFSAGPPARQVHGIMVVVGVQKAQAGRNGEPSWPAEVVTETIARTR